MNNKSKLLFLRGLMLILTLALADSVIAQANSVNVVYINGINNTLVEAQETQSKIYETLNASINHTGNAKKSFVVTGVWNPVGWYGTRDDQWNLSQDKKELFLLKTAEEKFASDFSRIVAPFNATTPIDRDAASQITAYLDDMTPGDNSLETGDNPVTDDDMQSTKDAVISLVNRVKARGTAIVVAHSQGNLLANLAYAKLASEFGNDLFNMMRVVNVANTSEFSVNNLNFTHAGDAALFSAATSPDQSLETLPSRGLNWTRTTPYCLNNGACNFTIAPATFVAQNDIDGQGFVDRLLDHSITETYLSTATVPVLNSQGITFTPNAESFVDRFEDFVYAAADSLSATALSGFSDNFNRPDSTTVGNGWTTLAGAGADLQIKNNETINVYGLTGIYRPLPSFTSPVTVSATLKEGNGYGGLLRRYGAELCILNDGVIGHGYCLMFTRGDQNYQDSAITLYDNQQQVGRVVSPLQYGAQIQVGITYLLDGSVSGTISSGGNTLNFSFGPRSIQSSGANFAYSTDGADTRTAVFTYPRLDDVVIGFGTTAATGRLNDTGITASQCYQTGSDTLVACNSAGAIALNNAQDGMTGRDADAASNSNTDGKLGFSFAAVPGGCVQDNVTGLMWEVKTTDGGLRDWNRTYTNFSAAYNP